MCPPKGKKKKEKEDKSVPGNKSPKKDTSKENSAEQSPNKDNENKNNESSKPCTKHPTQKNSSNLVIIKEKPKPKPKPREKTKEEIEREKKIKDLMKKQENLNKELSNVESQYNFEKSQREILLKRKEDDLSKKEMHIKNLDENNNILQNQYDQLQIAIRQKFDQISKENVDTERNKRIEPLELRLKVKKNDLKKNLSNLKKLKEDNEKIEKEINDKVDTKIIDELLVQIRSKEMIKINLTKEIKSLENITEEHDECIDKIKEIENNILSFKEKLKNVKDNNKSQIIGNSYTIKNIFEDKINKSNTNQARHVAVGYWKKNMDIIENNGDNDETADKKDIDHEKMKCNVKYRLKVLSDNKKVFEKNVLNNNLRMGTDTNLPPIKLFNNIERNLLKNILPENEMDKYERRFTSIDNSRINEERKYKVELQNLKNKNQELLNNYQYRHDNLTKEKHNCKLLEKDLKENKITIKALYEELTEYEEKINLYKNEIEKEKKKTKEITQRLSELEKEENGEDKEGKEDEEENNEEGEEENNEEENKEEAEDEQ